MALPYFIVTKTIPFSAELTEARRQVPQIYEPEQFARCLLRQIRLQVTERYKHFDDIDEQPISVGANDIDTDSDVIRIRFAFTTGVGAMMFKLAHGGE